MSTASEKGGGVAVGGVCSELGGRETLSGVSGKLGYCYAELFRCGMRDAEVRNLGAYPTFRQVFSRPCDSYNQWVTLSTFGCEQVEGSAFHLSCDGVDNSFLEVALNVVVRMARDDIVVGSFADMCRDALDRGLEDSFYWDMDVTPESVMGVPPAELDAVSDTLFTKDMGVVFSAGVLTASGKTFAGANEVVVQGVGLLPGPVGGECAVVGHLSLETHEVVNVCLSPPLGGGDTYNLRVGVGPGGSSVTAVVFPAGGVEVWVPNKGWVGRSGSSGTILVPSVMGRVDVTVKMCSGLASFVFGLVEPPGAKKVGVGLQLASRLFVASMVGVGLTLLSLTRYYARLGG